MGIGKLLDAYELRGPDSRSAPERPAAPSSALTAHALDPRTRPTHPPHAPDRNAGSPLPMCKFWHVHYEEQQLIVARYRLEKRLGSGGMGTVWRAWDELLHRRVAVKEVHLTGDGTRTTRTGRHGSYARRARSPACPTPT